MWKSAITDYDKVVASYKSGVLSAIAEVETTLVRVNSTRGRIGNAASAARNSRIYFNSIDANWRAGSASVLEREDARRSAQSAEITLIEIRRNAALLDRSLQGSGRRLGAPCRLPRGRRARQVTRKRSLMRSSRLLAPLLAAVFLSISGQPSHAQQNEAPALTVAVVKPTERQWAETVPARGWLQPWHEAIIASEIGNLRIIDVLVDVGSVVSKGQPLVRLAQETVLADLRKQEAAVATAKADLAKSKANANRARKLQGSGALSEEKVTEYLTTEQTATASLESAEADLESQKIKVNQTTIVAADDGLITSRSAQLGAVVSSGTELFRLLRQQRVEWQAEVSARYLPRIKQGLDAAIVGPGNRRIEGKVRLIGPTVSTNTGRAIVYVALPADLHPPVGIYAAGQIELQTSDALTVPETALVFRDGINYLFKISENQRVTRVRVETGRRNDSEVEILSGIDRSASVVKSGGAFLAENALVRIEGEMR